MAIDPTRFDLEAERLRIGRDPASVRRRIEAMEGLLRHWGCDVYVVTRSPAEQQRALELGALWAGPYGTKPPVALDQVIQLEDHRRAYEHPEWLSRASFLWSGSQRSSFRRLDLPSDPLDQLIALMNRLEKHGYDLIGVDITAADVARHGLRVVRAIVPGLQPLGFGRRVRLGGRRLYEAPLRMGSRQTTAREGDLNMVPHCFP